MAIYLEPDPSNAPFKHSDAVDWILSRKCNIGNKLLVESKRRPFLLNALE